MTDTIRFDVLYGHSTINPEYTAKLYVEKEYSELYEKTSQTIDFVIENGMDIMDVFEFIYDMMEGCF